MNEWQTDSTIVQMGNLKESTDLRHASHIQVKVLNKVMVLITVKNMNKVYTAIKVQAVNPIWNMNMEVVRSANMNKDVLRDEAQKVINAQMNGSKKMFATD